MENRFKLRISRMFRSSFGSCRSKTIAEMIEQPIFLPEKQHHQRHPLIELSSPKPKCSHTFQTERPSVISKNLRKSLIVSTDLEGQKCPPASPITPLNNCYQLQDCATSRTEEKKHKKAMNKRALSRSTSFGRHHHEFPALSYTNGLFSSDEDEEEDDKTTLFSSRSLSSDSSDQSFIRSKACRSNNKKGSKTSGQQKKAARNHESETGPVLELKGKAVKDSFAVVKRSNDPYNDFRTSMVEMIVEREIFAPKDLEKLLQCFLSLNSDHHHRVIIDVFTEIWEALFSEWS